MSKDIRYQYASGDLLEERNTYFYSGFQGEAFLDAWRSQRDAFLALAQRQGGGSRTPAAITPTETLLDKLERALVAGETDGARLAELDRLVQRFEVTKRVHAEYNENWRPVDTDDYRALGPYVRLGEVLELAYGKVRRLQYLNALLKCLDTLTALHEKLDDAQMERVRILVRAERVHAHNLAAGLRGSSQ
ncbi:hypothetical protein [Bordetella bronchialis]|uniref:Uncharacterized protein n=1 Tax=Bordetella bronchialis TaxID=463025 RepID=A0ABM6CY67_9BORD|nr:hypothetical protein [Bordetella bronchialis]ANN69079.1 hypothetical protein BAU06_24710 [Bordetella bronchialis]